MLYAKSPPDGANGRAITNTKSHCVHHVIEIVEIALFERNDKLLIVL